MKNKILILSKYAPSEITQQVIEKADPDKKNDITIIVKPQDKFTNSPLVTTHMAHMMGEVCDLLWEASTVAGERELHIASAKGYLLQRSTVDVHEDVNILCDEQTYSSFRFDIDNGLIESGELKGTSAYYITFKKADYFVNLAKKIILLKKEINGVFTLKTIINQAILNCLSVKVSIFKDNNA